MRVLHLPNCVGGNPMGLRSGEQKIGLDSQVLSFSKSKFQYSHDRLIDLDGASKLKNLCVRTKAFWDIRKGFDVYHFNFGSSILNYPNYGLILADLPYYDSSARKIMCYQGCDARQKYPTMERVRNCQNNFAACNRDGCYNGMCNSGRLDEIKRKSIEKAARHVDHMFAVNPDLLYFLPKEKSSFLPYTIDQFDQIQKRTMPFFQNDKITIAHAPTMRVTKGTDIVLPVLEELQTEFPKLLEIKLIENLTHTEALKAYREADLFIDQILIGWYGGVAVEVMKMGTPVAVYINPADLQFIPDAMRQELPFIQITPYNIKKVLRDFIKHREQVHQLSQQACAFVEKWHNPVNVAKRVVPYYLKAGQTLDLDGRLTV